MKRPILIHPESRLRKVADPAAAVDDGLRALIDDMFETMYDAPGVGLAAPQVGELTRLVVMDCADLEAGEKPDPVALINPEILWQSEELRTHYEGCLSIPDVYADIERPLRVGIRFLDREGQTVERSFDGIAATCVQHEIDHLNGKLFIDYLGPLKRQMITQKMKKLKRERARTG
ncbi:MAG: peptide deformylase [Paracoccaceae bacterium]